MSENSQGIQVISRAADVLRALKHDNGGLSLGKIAERVGLPRSTVQRIVNALIKERLVMMSTANSGLKLGPEIQSLALAGRIDVAELVRPILVQMSKDSGETIDLALFRNGQMVFVDQVVGSHRLRAVSSVGEVFPMSSTANGKAVLALMPETMANEIIKTECQYNSRRTPAIVGAEVAKVRRTDMAFDRDEHTDGISAVGAAFADPLGLLYAISIPVPSRRFDTNTDTLTAVLKAGMAKIAKAIGDQDAEGAKAKQ